MSKRKKKNAIKLSLLLLALIALIGFYAWYSKNAKTSKKNQTSSDLLDEAANTTSNKSAAIALATMDSTKVNSLHFINKSADLTLVLKDKAWISEQTPDRPINQDHVTSMLDAIKDLKAISVINEKPEDLSEYGLTEPSSTLEVSQSDGTSLKIKIGSKAAGNSGYYALVNDKAAVYLLSTSVGEAFSYSDTDMTTVEEIPSTTADKIRRLAVTKRDGENFEIKYDTANTVDTTGMGLYPWVILKPYEGKFTGDSTNINELLAKYISLKFVSCIDYSGENLSKYGLDNPADTVLVEYEEEETKQLDTPQKDPDTGKEITEKTVTVSKNYKLYIGSQDDSGNYYVMKDGSKAVYTMKSDSVEGMLNIDAFSLMNKYISIPNIDKVDKIEVQMDGKTYTMEIKRTTAKDTSGKDTTTSTYYYNGNTVEEATFKSVYQKMIVAKYDSELGKEVSTGSLQPDLTITYYVSGKTLKTSYLPYNDSFYLVDNGGKVMFCADKRQISDIMTAIKEFKAAE